MSRDQAGCTGVIARILGDLHERRIAESPHCRAPSRRAGQRQTACSRPLAAVAREADAAHRCGVTAGSLRQPSQRPAGGPVIVAIAVARCAHQSRVHIGSIRATETRQSPARHGSSSPPAPLLVQCVRYGGAGARVVPRMRPLALSMEPHITGATGTGAASLRLGAGPYSRSRLPER